MQVCGMGSRTALSVPSDKLFAAGGTMLHDPTPSQVDSRLQLLGVGLLRNAMPVVFLGQPLHGAQVAIVEVQLVHLAAARLKRELPRLSKGERDYSDVLLCALE
eukprot:CAMPEP_0206545998 /NCGR_PEP_ID=MMETSP0325_2-20121206/12453_1 /ASSEMBLY_ACC=CAM_ASM_000347 /TAXON_ID=2866 /ORGANISM="Crypthecodinium cohnii, Strain Seligo" /LENGTH=103 /DNA_ID=CAMNT_0054045057 /DNA_START=89 /DNA_END=400 /DNA_ORIENTATION=-